MREDHDAVLIEHGPELLRDLKEMRDEMVAHLAVQQSRGNLKEKTSAPQIADIAALQGCINATDAAIDDARKRNR